MTGITFQRDLSQTRLCAIVEVIGGKLKIYPVADSDAEAAKTLDALRFAREDCPG